MTADLILHNANVYTLDPLHPRAEMIAVANGKIIAVCDNTHLKRFRGQTTEVIDCTGRTVLPGFHDAHCHIVGLAETLITPDISPSAVRSITDIQNKIREAAENLEPGQWIVARGYNEFYLTEKRHPDKHDLDKATTVHPVKLAHRTGHAHVLNSRALELAGITVETPEPPGGLIEREFDTGEPNGLLIGMGSYLEGVIPSMSEQMHAQGMELADRLFLSQGITAVQDLSPRNNLARWHLIRDCMQKGLFHPRTTVMVSPDALPEFADRGPEPESGNDRLRMTGVKIILDENRGSLNPDQQALNQIVLDVHRQGYQVAMHAVESSTIEAACTALEYALARYPRNDHRHRIEHCSECTPELAGRLAGLGVVVVSNPAFIYYSGERYLRTIPEKQRQYLYPLATMLSAGLKIAAGSDCPVTPPDPLTGIYAAVTRASENGLQVLPGEAITPLDALHLHIDNAAYSCFAEDYCGQLKPGMMADLIVLDDDPLSSGPAALKKISVDITIIGGKVVWAR